MVTSPYLSPFMLVLPNDILDMQGIQFSCGKFSSWVSSIEMILSSGGMNEIIAFRKDVFPAPVPPQISMFTLCSMTYQRYASSSVVHVLSRMRSTML